MNAAMNLAAALQNSMGLYMQNNIKALRITDADIRQMHAVPVDRRQKIMSKIMALTPTSTRIFNGQNHYENALLNLRQYGFRLIDLQPQEYVLTSVWCRNGFIGWPRLEVAMLLWVAEEDSTTFTKWQIWV